ncbi:MAG: hypothetical protein A4E65_00294 [Syntrophorhabdus sp. PtaU1.Bin153]|nr:MAG: hypothetical protein A4E65_00294 [Syntrophorhabdus sp. PtaU1.Bin153]
MLTSDRLKCPLHLFINAEIGRLERAVQAFHVLLELQVGWPEMSKIVVHATSFNASFLAPVVR